MCYVLKGLVPAPFDPAARMCLPGGDHRGHPRTFASTAAIHRALVLDWARQQGWPCSWASIHTCMALLQAQECTCMIKHSIFFIQSPSLCQL